MIETDPKLKELVEYVRQSAYNLLIHMHDLSNHQVVFDSMYHKNFHKNDLSTSQEYIHENGHTTFYFLRNDNSSFPLFHDPRP